MRRIVLCDLILERRRWGKCKCCKLDNLIYLMFRNVDSSGYKKKKGVRWYERNGRGGGNVSENRVRN